MPSSSKKQHNFMAAIAHSPSFARKVGVPQRVGKDFTEADKGKKFMNPRARKKGGALGYAPGGVTPAKPGQVPKGKDPAQWWSANEAGAVKPGEKSYLPPKKKIPPKTKKYAEGGDISDEDTVSENVKEQTAKLNKPVTTQSEKPRGFFGKIFKTRSKNVGPDGQDWKKLDKTPESSFDEDGESEGVKKYKESLKSDEDTMSEQAKSNIEKKTSGAPEQKKQSFKEAFAAAKGKNFTWNGKKFSGAMKGATPKAKTATAPAKKDDSKSVLFKKESPSFGGMSRSMSGTEKYAAGAGQSRSEQMKKAKEDWNSLRDRLDKSYMAKQKAKADAAKKKKSDAAANFKPSANKSFNYKKGGWIQSAIKKPGALRQSLHVKAGEKIPAKKLNAAAKAPGKMGQRARLAKTLGGFCGGGSTKAYRSGGLVSSRADGIASRGRTKCKIV